MLITVYQWKDSLDHTFIGRYLVGRIPVHNEYISVPGQAAMLWRVTWVEHSALNSSSRPNSWIAARVYCTPSSTFWEEAA